MAPSLLYQFNTRISVGVKPRAAPSPFRVASQSPLSARVFRSPVEMSSALISMLPYHTATASALLNSMLTVAPRTSAWTIEGCLLLSCYYTSEGLWTDEFGVEERLEGWMMEGDEAWAKCFSFGERGSAAVLRDARPVAYLKSRGQVFVQNESYFYLLDVEKSSRKKVTVHGLPECFTCQSFRGSLVRLIGDDDDRVGGRAAGGSRRKKKRAQSRFKLGVTVDDLCGAVSSLLIEDED